MKTAYKNTILFTLLIFFSSGLWAQYDAPIATKFPDTEHICCDIDVWANITFPYSFASCNDIAEYRSFDGSSWTVWTPYNNNDPINAEASFEQIEIRAYQSFCDDGTDIFNSDTLTISWTVHQQVTRESFIKNPVEEGLCLFADVSLTDNVDPNTPVSIEYQYQAPAQTGWLDGNTISPAQSGMAWIRAKVVSQGYGCNNLDWEWFAWLVQEQPQINGLSDQDICIGTTANLQANVVDGYGVNSYIWQKSDNDCDGEWQNVGTNENQFTTEIFTENTTANYRLIVNQSGYNCADTSVCINIVVHDSPTIEIQSDNNFACQGEEINYTANIDGDAQSQFIVWQIKTQGGEWTNYQNTDEFGITISDIDEPYSIRAILNQDEPNCTAISNELNTEIFPLVVFTSQPQSIVGCQGYPATFTVEAVGYNPITYQWFGPQGEIDGETTNVLSIDSIENEDFGDYYCVATNYCNSATSDIATLSIGEDYTAATQISGEINRCAGAGSNQYAVDAVNPTSFQWEISPANAGTIDENGLVIWDASFEGVAIISYTALGCGQYESISLEVENLQHLVDPTTVIGDDERCQGHGSSQYSTDAENAISHIWQIINAGTSTINNDGNVVWDAYFSGTATIGVIATGCDHNSPMIYFDVLVKENTPLESEGSLDICEGETAIFVAITDTVTIFDYQWFGPQGILAGENSETLIIDDVSSADDGIYYCQLTTYCGLSFTPNDTLTVHQQPNVSFTVEPNCMTEIVMFTNTSTTDDLPLTAFWDFDDGNFSNDFHPQHIFENDGQYTVKLIATTHYGCSDSTTQQLEIYQKPFFDITSSDLLCFEDNSGFISVEPTGGNAPYDFILNGVVGDTSYFGGLEAGFYEITVIDDNQCVVKDTVRLTQPHPLTSFYEFSDVLCYGDSTGQITPHVNGGTPPYEYLWSNGDTTEVVNLPTGTYDLTITDANNCTNQHSGIYIWQPNPIVVDSILIQRTCELLNDGYIAVFPTGGYGTYEFLWSNGETNDSIISLATGLYTVTITDENNCPYIQTFEILPNEELCWEIWTSFSPNGDGVNDVWNIRNSELYPDMKVTIFNRWGAKVYQSKGIYIPWNGTGPAGKLVPPETYYWIIDLGDNSTKTMTGTVTVIY